MHSLSKEQLWRQRTEWPLALVAVAFLIMYSVQILARPHGTEARILWLLCWVAWAMFVGDYFARLVLADNRREWFLLHLLDLVIVMLPFLRPLRPLRMVRLIVLLGVLQRAVGHAVRGQILIYTVSGVLLLVYTGALAVLDAERQQVGTTINSFGKAVWWAITTVTTVGYGNLYPVTVTGRVVAVLLMMGGITLIGVVTGSLASWIVQRVSENDTANQVATAAQIDELRGEIRELAEQLRAREATGA
ncbi:ion transporter [Mycobacterium gordonae]|jgi:voltage-gated potassium channel|uniref:Ion transporter n=1 Tax=Mycobacterium gordonae TaxID=1778 RepID=A0A1A6BBB8_MYCGO|nr:potassium channel family protein [Mycobacterium gordonae]MBI2698315.1 potassium channel family protein [Mycobacterium sp.]OBR99622.1 ion transporter [Mycobacterium gordonae]